MGQWNLLPDTGIPFYHQGKLISARVEQPAKGPGTYQRKTKHTTKPDEQN
jgi:hypothetical protein